MSRLVGILVLGYAITPLHPGTGRSPGLVDLPIQRDPLGYPMIYASGLKGALKSLCARKIGNKCIDTRTGRIKCNDGECGVCCCLFGPEPGEGEKGAGLLSVLDFTIFAVPIPSIDKGYLYITSPYISRRSLGVLDILLANDIENNELKYFKELIERIAYTDPNKYYTTSKGERVGILHSSINTEPLPFDGDLSKINNLLKNVGPMLSDFTNRLVIVPDNVATQLIDKGIMRITRVRLRIDVKTAAKGNLWTEEYLPIGTFLIGGLIASIPRRNEYCSKYMNEAEICDEECAKKIIGDFKEKLGIKDAAYMIVGGKETIGKGLIKLRIM